MYSAVPRTSRVPAKHTPGRPDMQGISILTRTMAGGAMRNRRLATKADDDLFLSDEAIHNDELDQEEGGYRPRR